MINSIALSPKKRVLLALKLKQQVRKPLAKQTIHRRAISVFTPLSFAQQRIWFQQQAVPTSPVFNAYRSWRLLGPLDVRALEKAIEGIVVRHEILRSLIEIVDGKPTLRVVPHLNIPLSVTELHRLSNITEREKKSEELAMTDAKIPFDLANGPLFRPQLLRLADDHHIFLLTLHHIVADGWSIGILHQELNALYRSFKTGEFHPLPDLPIQYSDYVFWQHEQMQNDAMVEHLSYWKRQLANLPTLELPMERPSRQSHQGDREIFQVSYRVSNLLRHLSQREGATLFMTLLAAFKILLYHYTLQADVVIGTPVANRKPAELEPLIGLFVNTLVLRTDLSGNPSFRELLGRVKNVALMAYTRQDMPFAKLVEEFQLHHETGRHPLFQVFFQLQNTPAQSLALPGVQVSPFITGSVSPFNAGNDTAKFKLTVSMIDTHEGLKGMFEYSTDLFNGTTIRGMVDHFQVLLTRITTEPDQRIHQLNPSL